MKNSIILTLLFIGTIFFVGCNESGPTPSQEQFQLKKVSLLYFHGDRRCKTCKAVGALAQKVCLSYGDNKNVGFFDINYDNNETIAENYGVTGSSLIVNVNGEVNDITVFAFQNAINNPTLLEDKIKAIINQGLSRE